MPYFFVQALDNNNIPIHERLAKANDAQQACKLAFGTISKGYRALDIGSRNPRYLSSKKLEELRQNGNWITLT